MLQDIAVKEQCLNFSNDSMLFLINFPDLKKNALRTDGRTDQWTDRPTDRRTDGWTVGLTDGRTDPYIEMCGRI